MSGWTRAAFGGREAEAENRGGKTNLCQAWLHGGASVRRDGMGRQEAIDELAWFGQSAGRVFVDMPGAQREKDREESVWGAVSLPGKYNKLIEEAVLGYRQKTTIDLGRD